MSVSVDWTCRYSQFPSRLSFLGPIESILKEGYVTFFREDKVCFVRQLLSSFNDLDCVYTTSRPGKWTAQLGLSFTSTVSTVQVRVSPFLSSHGERGERGDTSESLDHCRRDVRDLGYRPVSGMARDGSVPPIL